MLRQICKQAQIRVLKESLLNSYGDEDQEPVSSVKGLDNAYHIVPTTLLIRVLRLRKGSVKVVEGPNSRPTVFSVVTFKE